MLWLGQPVCAGSLWILCVIVCSLSNPSVSWDLALCLTLQQNPAWAFHGIASIFCCSGQTLCSALSCEPPAASQTQQHPRFLYRPPNTPGFGFSASPPLGLLLLLRGNSEWELNLAVGQAMKHWQPTALNLCNTLLILVSDMARADNPQGWDVCSHSGQHMTYGS